jgi:hypothetical protein
MRRAALSPPRDYWSEITSRKSTFLSSESIPTEGGETSDKRKLAVDVTEDRSQKKYRC